MSPATVGLWFNISNVVLLIGAALVLLGTFGSIRMGATKEVLSDQRIAESTATAAKANEAAALANERAAKLEKEAAEMRLKLEKTASDTQFAVAAAIASL